MLGTGKLLSFSFRALVLLVLLPLLWITVADRYNQALVALARPVLPADISVRAVDSYLLIDHSRLTTSVSIEGYTLHYGLILLAVLVLAAVGIEVVPRLVWLLGLAVGAFLTHVIGLVLLAQGVVWASGSASVESSGTMVFSLFAVFWGLLPPLVGGAWCFMYWLPRIRDVAPASPPSAPPGRDVD